MLNKSDISTIITVLKAREKCVLADVICWSKMTSFMALDSVNSFLRLKDVTNTRERMRRSLSICGSFQCNGGKLEETEDFKCVFVVYVS